MARDYAAVTGRFWTGDTGRLLRARGAETQLVALYLVTCPSSNMVGLYYLPIPTLVHETGMSTEGAWKALRSLSEVGFAYYDEDQEVVWVPEMARYQVGSELKAEDKRVKGVLKMAAAHKASRYHEAFLEKYRRAFNLGPAAQEAPPKPHAAPSEGPSKALRSQEQDQEQEQDQKAAAARALARDGAITKLGPGEAEAEPPPPSAEVSPGPAVPVQAGTAGPEEVPPSASIPTPTPAAVGHPAEDATSPTPVRQLRAMAPPDDDLPRRPVPVLDTTELDEGAAEVRAELERRAEWKFLVAAHERRTEVRSKLEALVAALGVERSVNVCWSVLERRKALGQQPPKALAFFVPLLEELLAGGDPMPPEVARVDVDQVRAMHDLEVEARWEPLIAQMNPLQREAYEAEKRRLLGEVRAKGLWTSEEARQLDEAEQFLFTKWSRRVGDQATVAEA